MLQDPTSFSKLIYDLCEVINTDIKGRIGDHNASRLAAMDIGCGYHSYIVGIAMRHLEVLNYEVQ